MAESYVEVTQGTGTKTHSFQRVIGTNTVEDSVVLLGEPYLATYAAQASGISTGTAGSRLMTLTAGASLRLRVRRIEIHQLALAGAAARLDVVFQRHTAAPTGGTAVSVFPLDTTDAAASATVATLQTGGTLSGTFWRPALSLYATAPIGAGASWVWEHQPNTKPLIVPAGTANGFVIVNVNAVATATVNMSIVWDETNF